MVQVAANVEKAVDARGQYVYQQTVRASLARTNGQFVSGHTFRDRHRKETGVLRRAGALAFAVVRELRQTLIHEFNAAAIEKFPTAGCSHQCRPSALIRYSYDSTRRNDVPSDSGIRAAP
jgi:hypothetical protein